MSTTNNGKVASIIFRSLNDTYLCATASIPGSSLREILFVMDYVIHDGWYSLSQNSRGEAHVTLRTQASGNVHRGHDSDSMRILGFGSFPNREMKDVGHSCPRIHIDKPHSRLSSPRRQAGLDNHPLKLRDFIPLDQIIPQEIPLILQFAQSIQFLL